MSESEAELARLGWRVCPSCNRRRDIADLFPRKHTTCLICQRKAERTREGMLHRSTRQLAASRNARRGARERYAAQLASAGYTQAQIDRYVSQRFNIPIEEITHAES